MLTEYKHQIAAVLAATVQQWLQAADLPAEVPVVLERPKSPEHGDWACHVALQLARPLKRTPRALAQGLVDTLLDSPAAALLAGIEIAGPGFINLRLTAAAKQAVVPCILQQGADYGRSTAGDGRKVVVEFVSANPTGPLHVGHGRQGALGDALAALLTATGWQVQREFYYNDAGAQIQHLAHSVQARARGLTPDDPGFPAEGYRGEYIVDIARAYMAGQTVAAHQVAPVTAAADPDDLAAIRAFAVAYLRREQDLDLQALGVRFDHYALESALYTEGKVAALVAALVAAGHAYEAEGALWLRSTDYGDDKDRVMRKSDGTYTYFVADVAYHVDKWQRGFSKAINVQGSDHHGTVARVRAGLQALGVGIAPGYPDYVLHKMVTVMRAGQEVKISKRAGSYVTLRDLIEWSGGLAGVPSGADTPERAEALRRGRDAVRFFLISRKADSEFVFDIDLALARTDDNPVYYLQYAHARICSVWSQWQAAAPDATEAAVYEADLTPLTSPRELALLARLAEFPVILTDAARELAPHALAFWLRELAAEFHGYYNAERFLVADLALRHARMALLAAVRQVLRNGLDLIGVSAPERM